MRVQAQGEELRAGLHNYHAHTGAPSPHTQAPARLCTPHSHAARQPGKILSLPGSHLGLSSEVAMVQLAAQLDTTTTSHHPPNDAGIFLPSTTSGEETPPTAAAEGARKRRRTRGGSLLPPLAAAALLCFQCTSFEPTHTSTFLALCLIHFCVLTLPGPSSSIRTSSLPL